MRMLPTGRTTVIAALPANSLRHERLACQRDGGRQIRDGAIRRRGEGVAAVIGSAAAHAQRLDRFAGADRLEGAPGGGADVGIGVPEERGEDRDRPVEETAFGDHGRTAQDLGLLDTVVVWPGERVRIAIDFAQPYTGTQTYMLHCHNLEHEDQGMMVAFAVVD